MVATPYSGWFGLPSTACIIIFYLLHFSSQAFAVAVPANKTMCRIITPFTLPIFMARHRLIVRTSSVRQILERLFDFVVFNLIPP